MPTREEYLRFAQAGLTPSEISEATGASVNAVTTGLTRARQDGHDVPRFRRWPPDGSVRLRVPFGIVRLLQFDADKRGISVTELCNRLLEQVALDKIADAVLDDTGGDDG